MTSPLQSLVDAGTKVWLDSVDPDEIDRNKARGATGATSNPIIIAGLVGSGRFDKVLLEKMKQADDDEELAWLMTDHLVTLAQQQFEGVWEQTAGNDGWVSFELDPLLEDAELGPSHDERVSRYIELAKRWSAGHKNRMIKVPATAAGLDALEEIAAAGTTINTTLIFTERQYEAARDAVWRGRQRFGDPDTFKSVYSIFISRVDVYTDKHVDSLSDDAQGRVGLLNAKRLYLQNRDFWADKGVKLDQEIIFASTGKKLGWQPEDFYVEAVAGDDIQTNPPETNEWVANSGKIYTSKVAQLPPQAVQDEIDEKVDVQAMEDKLMEEGTAKFADPHKELIAKIADRRSELVSS